MALHQLTVLQVLPALESGGVERGVLEVAEGLVAAGHRSLVISGGGRMVAELTNRGSQHFEKARGRRSLSNRLVGRTMMRVSSLNDREVYGRRRAAFGAAQRALSRPCHDNDAMMFPLS